MTYDEYISQQQQAMDEEQHNYPILTFESDIMNNASLNIYVNYDKDYLQTVKSLMK